MNIHDASPGESHKVLLSGTVRMGSQLFISYANNPTPCLTAEDGMDDDDRRVVEAIDALQGAYEFDPTRVKAFADDTPDREVGRTPGDRLPSRIQVFKFIAAIVILLAAVIQRHSTRRKIHRAPGMCLDAVAEFLFSRKTYEDVFQQQIADLRLEHAEALAANRLWKARWIRVRYVIAFIESALQKAPVIEQITKLIAGLGGKTAGK